MTATPVFSDPEDDLPKDQACLSIATGASHVAGSGAVATYVSLFMILFVFFIVLFSIASQQRARSLAVLSSLDRAFGHLPSAIGLLSVPSDDDFSDDPTTSQFIADVDSGLKTFVPGAHSAERPRPGTILNLEVAPESLFEPGTPALKAAALPALSRLAVLLQRHRGGLRFQIDITAVTRGLDAGRELATARVTALAAQLYAQGCPTDAMTVAVSQAPTTSLRFDFLALPAETSSDAAGR